MDAARHKADYEAVALALGNALTADVTIDKVDLSAQGILKVYRRSYKHAHISSSKAQAVLDYVLSLRDARLEEEVKVKRLVEFVRALVREENPELPKLLEYCGANEPPDVQVPDFKVLVHDEVLATIFTERWMEAEMCVAGKACLAAVVMMGSLFEGVLLARVIANPQAASQSPEAPRAKGDKLRQFHEWTLTDLINVAHSCGWLDMGADSFSHMLLNYKDYIHPWHHVAHSGSIGEWACTDNWGVVSYAVAALVEGVR
jgi:hypothetical protein